jgi:hypothetical protein
MSIISLSVGSEKSRLVFRKSSHYTKIFEYFHFREFFIRSFHLYGFCVWVFICMGFAYGFSSVWVLRMSFHLYGFCVWVFICMDFAYEFSSVDFHLWGLFFVKYASEAFFWWKNHHTNVLLQCEASLHYYITSSHVFFRFHVFVIFTSLSSFFIKKTKFSKRTNFS